MARKKIRLLDGAFQTVSIVPKDDAVLTKVKFTSKFDQIVAEALGIKSSLYDSNGTLLSGMQKWELEILLFGAKICVIPTQGDLFDEKAGKALEIDSIQLSDAAVRRLRADEALRISFTVTIAGIPREMLDYVEGIRKNTISITVEPASKEREQTAKSAAITHGLFSEVKDPDADEDDEADDAGEGEAEDEEAIAAAAEQPEPGTLARAGAMKARKGAGIQ